MIPQYLGLVRCFKTCSVLAQPCLNRYSEQDIGTFSTRPRSCIATSVLRALPSAVSPSRLHTTDMGSGSRDMFTKNFFMSLSLTIHSTTTKILKHRAHDLL